MESRRTPFELEVFFDGDCPLCTREIAMLDRLDRRDRVRFVDIAADAFDAESVGVSWETLMARIHGRLPDGTLVEGVEVFRRISAAIGLGWIGAVTRLPGLSQAFDLSYRTFAANRLRLTGRCLDESCTPQRGT